MTPTKPNRLTRLVSALQRAPRFMRWGLINLVLGRAVPLVGTAGLRFEELSAHRVVVRVRNRRGVQNHIKGVHAAAMALLVETATGFCVGMNLPDDRLPLLKSMKVNYLKRAQGDLVAVASLSEAQIHQVLAADKGEIAVPVQVTDAAGQVPIECELVWAWIKRDAGPLTPADRS